MSRRGDDDPGPKWLIPSGTLAGYSGPGLPEPIEAEDVRTPGQRRRAKRDVVIAVAVGVGLSQRFVAAALGLPRSLVGEAVARYQRRFDGDTTAPAAQGDFSDVVAHAELNLWFGGRVITPPATLYVGLSTHLSYHLSNVIFELSGGGYARVAVTNDPTHWPAAKGRTKRNGTDIVFPVATAGWGQVQSWFVMDSAGAGTVLASGSLPTPITIQAGQPAMRFDAGSLVFGK